MEADVDTTAIAPKMIPPSIPWLNHLGGGVFASIATASARDRVRVVNVIQQDVPLLSEHIGEEMRLVHVVIHPAQSNDPNSDGDGTYQRILLRMADGKIFASGAKGVFQSLILAVAAYGRPPWKDGIPIACRQKSAGKSGRWLYLELLMPKEENPSDEIPL